MISAVVALFVIGVGEYCEQREPPADQPPADQPTVRVPTEQVPTDNREPHPDYPTIERAGTAELFFIEEPERGPWITDAERPTTDATEWRYHAHCEIDLADVICGPPVPTRPSLGWRLARSENVLVADALRFDHIDETYILTFDATDALEQLVALDATGHVVWSRSYLPAGEQFAERALSGANRLPGCGYHRIDRDATGVAQGVSCVSWLGDGMRDTDGVVSRRLERNSAGFVIEERFLDASGAPSVSHDGVHRRVTERDELGREIATSFFDLEGQSVLSADERASRVDIDHNELGQVVARRITGPEGQPGSDAVALERRTYDARGCTTRTAYFDALGAPTTDFHGVHQFVTITDDRCLVTQRTCLDTNRQLTRCGPAEPHQVRHQYDDRGWVISTQHFDASGQPSVDAEFQVFEVRYEYDDLGRAVRVSCFGTNAAPVECTGTGFHCDISEFDDAGRSVATTFESQYGGPATNMGVSRRRATFDAYDHIFETIAYDAAGRVIDTSGLARQRYLYDDGHRLFGMLLFDRRDQPASYSGCFTGRSCPSVSWHAVAVIRGADGRATENRFFDHNAQLISSIDCRTTACWE